jgi:Subunit 17 of Mediator complex
MTLAKDVLALFAASTAPASLPSALNADSSSVPVPSNSLLASSSVSQPPSIASVQSFNARLVAGGKDEALRKASELFKLATIAVERGHDVGARYWIDALKIRRRNWGLTPAPLPPGMFTGRGADRTTKDFLISFGLSECMLFSSNFIYCSDTHPDFKSVACLPSESDWPTRYTWFKRADCISAKTEDNPSCQCQDQRCLRGRKNSMQYHGERTWE